jgi:uncharacterized protein
MIESLAAFLIAAGIGNVAALIGMGGGFLYVPTLTLIFGFDPRMAVGTSLAIMVLSASAATIVYRRQGKILYRAAAILFIPSMIFSVIGSFLTSVMDVRVIVAAFAMVLILISCQMLFPALRIIRKIPFGPGLLFSCPGQGEADCSVTIPASHLIIWGAMGGLVSGVTGTSGGAFFVPALVAIGVPIHFAVATSLLTIIPTSLAGASTHALLGHLSLPFLALYGSGAAIGAYAGATLAPRIHADHIKRIFGVLLLIIAVIMIQQKVMG